MQNLLALNSSHLFLSVMVVILSLAIFAIWKFFPSKFKKEKKKNKEPFSIGEITQLARDNEAIVVGTRIHEGMITDRNIPMNFSGKTDFKKEPFYRILVEEDGESKYLFVQKNERDFCILKKDFPIFFCDQGNDPIEILIEDDRDFDALHTAHYP